MKKRFLLVFALLVSFVLLTGCGKDSNELVGKWKGLSDGEIRDYQIETTFEFTSDGKVTYANEFGITGEGTYEIKEDVVTIKLNVWDNPKDYKFKVDGEKLSLMADDPYSPDYSELVKQ